MFCIRIVTAMNGILLVDKVGMPSLPAGEFVAPADPAADLATGPRRSPFPTSHDVVQQVRRLTKQKRIGHTGTLDPMASGLMALCLGWATRLVEYYQGHDKRYTAEIALGAETDTLDALGKIVDRAPVPALTIADIEAALDHFRGSIDQVPPVYSALKQEGESVHYKVRRGEEVEMAARSVTIHALTLLDWRTDGRMVLDVRCSAGTYIRSLARDLGRTLGTRGVLVALRRLEAGAFDVIHAHTIADIARAAEADTLHTLLLPPGAGLDLPALTIDAPTAERLGHGQSVTLENAPTGVERVAAHAQSGKLIGILAPLAGDANRWKADKWFGNENIL